MADESGVEAHQYRADTTVTFTAPKAANVLPPASRFNGELIVADIDSPQELIDEQPSHLYLAETEDAARWLKKSGFSSDDYKNKRGHALVIAGSEDYSGAAVLAGNAAIRSGAGLVTLACPTNAKAEIASRLLPEVILSTIESDEFAGHFERADAVAVGCGLDANDPDIGKLVREVVETGTKPVIVDAGALWFFNPPEENHPGGETPPPLLSKEGSLESSPMILTPHEGEFLRLLGDQGENYPVGETPPPLLRKEGSLKEDRVAAVREYAVANNVILVLKGERVLIGSP
ncbi:MAG: NAD(P)H-hydrate dehydratase, partial [Pyrinomonadaceae bacterium]